MRRPSYVSRRSESSGCRAEQYIVRNPDERRYCIRALPRVEEAELTWGAGRHTTWGRLSVRVLMLMRAESQDRSYERRMWWLVLVGGAVKCVHIFGWYNLYVTWKTWERKGVMIWSFVHWTVHGKKTNESHRLPRAPRGSGPLTTMFLLHHFVPLHNKERHICKEDDKLSRYRSKSRVSAKATNGPNLQENTIEISAGVAWKGGPKTKINAVQNAILST